MLLPLPGSLGLVDWAVDPSTDPFSSTLVLAATERACVGGQPMGDRLVIAEVIETPTEVGVVLGTEPPPGAGFTCPDNPITAVAIELDEPLGDREVRNGLAWGADLADLIGALGPG